ncbi:MAG: hypothetical protein UU02_C0026G0009 [Candidatus Woesebacteria bacterium GW2011_GWA1_40_43]|uniref:Uncharacterized protein n=1 Tax=Candidatus Woesebacteria bacterium GW2011_GWA1_40_43 TaxID=1618553 RepID=A0A0G0SLV1_9BACT|nr:MAG: hypothetical protein UU02_C0026G0009 [Candidatus Woesebacteria bacterium GW2011_GWA1_40_43]
MKNFLLVAAIFIFAFAVLFISIFDSSAINYPVSQSPYQPLVGSKAPEINYHLPYSGNVLPDSPLWPLKALRDKVWIGVTTSHLRRAELALLFSDKRLVMTQRGGRKNCQIPGGGYVYFFKQIGLIGFETQRGCRGFDTVSTGGYKATYYQDGRLCKRHI